MGDIVCLPTNRSHTRVTKARETDFFHCQEICLTETSPVTDSHRGHTPVGSLQSKTCPSILDRPRAEQNVIHLLRRPKGSASSLRTTNGWCVSDGTPSNQSIDLELLKACLEPENFITHLPQKTIHKRFTYIYRENTKSPLQKKRCK